jgi:prepilin-type processing-associated H-X9-DG protein
MRDRNNERDGNQIGFQIQHRGTQGGCNIGYVDGHIQFHKAFLTSPPWYGLPPAAAALFENTSPYTDRAPPVP